MLIMSIIGWDSSEQPNGLFDNSSKNSWFGNFGIYVAYYQTRYLIGYYTLIFNVLFFYMGFLLFSNKGFKNQSKIFTYSIFIALWLSVFTASILMESINYDIYSGLIGFLISNFLFTLFKPSFFNFRTRLFISL